ncbi:hypothetical protein JCM3770_006747 [Rhodotorula araucariae]
MSPPKLPNLPVELVDLILEEAFPGLHKQAPRIAPRWLVHLVGEDVLARLDATPAHDYRDGICALQGLVLVPVMWAMYARFSLDAGFPPAWVRILTAVSYFAITAGADP